MTVQLMLELWALWFFILMYAAFLVESLLFGEEL